MLCTLRLFLVAGLAIVANGQTPCAIGDPTSTCPTPLTCTPTEPPPPTGAQGGVCITPAPPGPSSACIVDSPITTCSGPFSCSAFFSTCTTSACLGTCVSEPTPPPPKRCTEPYQCGRGARCAKRPGSWCEPSPWCPGICVPEGTY